ncbi:MAG: hypothetical protein L6R43_09040 [Planctomycetes bacterium]|nr:hypothetical protein [Planctomycetota bacterium]
MTVVTPSRVRWGSVALVAALPAIAVCEFLCLKLLPDTPTWGAAVGGIVVAVLVVAPILLWRIRGPRWVWAGLGLAVVIGLPLSFLRGLDCCKTCGMYRRHVDLGWGVGDAWLRLPLGRSARTTHALSDFFDETHRHDWGFCFQHMDGAFLLNTVISGGYRSCGSSYRNRFSARYEEDEAFRSLVKGKIATGETTPEQVRLLLSLPLSFHRISSVPSGTHALVKKAGEWMGEYFWYPELEKDWPPEEATSK